MTFLLMIYRHLNITHNTLVSFMRKKQARSSLTFRQAQRFCLIFRLDNHLQVVFSSVQMFFFSLFALMNSKEQFSLLHRMFCIHDTISSIPSVDHSIKPIKKNQISPHYIALHKKPILKIFVRFFSIQVNSRKYLKLFYVQKNLFT